MTDDPMSHDPMNDDRLGEILRIAAPQGPDPVDRAAAVVRRGRASRRRRGAGGVLAVGVVALAVVVGPNLLDTGAAPSNQAGPGPHPLTPPTVGQLDHPYACPRPGRPDRKASSPPTDRIPDGAVLARICPVEGTYFSAWAPPLDALVTHVDQVSAAYNDLPKARPLPCPGYPTPRPSFSVTFQYPDGHLVRVRAETIGTGDCSFISIVGRHELGRSSSGTVMETYFRELQQQRATQSPPAQVSPAVCPAHLPRHGSALGVAPSLIPANHNLELTSAVVCEYPTDPYEKTAPRFGSLTDSQVGSVDEEYRAHVTKSRVGTACLSPFPPRELLIGKSAWGDSIVMSRSCSAWERVEPTVHVPMYWTPSPALNRSLFAALKR